jgi:nickel/cobalt exporter
MYSAFVTQGQGKDGELLTEEELASLAKTNVESLAEFDYFTYAKAANQKLEFGAPTDYSLEERQDKRVVLHFTLPLSSPASASKAFSFQVYDPTYFGAFEMEKDHAVSMSGAPKGCSINELGANPLAAADSKKLTESFFSGLSPGYDFGVKLAGQRIEFSAATFWRWVRRGLAAAWPCFPLAVLLIVALLPCPSLGQGVHHPFAVGANEGAAGSAQGIMGFILAKEADFFRLLSAAIRATKQSGMAAWWLVALSFAYGVFHAAGPGHGKAVIASYMLANERALRRGLVIAFGAALVQGVSAVAIVGISTLIFKATAKHMTAAANTVEIASYAGIVVLGAILLYVKGAALLSAWRAEPALGAVAAEGGATAVFAADDCSSHHIRGPGCGHFHAPDPRALEAGFSWKSSLLTMMAAGLRPCSGAILVLVFALAQGIFSAGVLAVAAMSLGTAITTAALASGAVLAKNVSIKYSKADSRQALIAGRLFEALAALAVLGLGLVLLLAAFAGRSGAN